jgi:acetyl esterase/lipase
MPTPLRIALDALALPERHRYGPHRYNRADLYLPRGDGPHPVAVVIHGGYWQATYGKAIMKLVCADLSRRGVAAWNIEYRRLGRGQGGGWPATFDDVAAAIDHLPAVADGRVRLDDVSAVGHSAGGHLALWAAARRDAAVPLRRVAAQAAVCDLESAGKVARELMGGTPEQHSERWASADPMRRLPLGVPVRLIHTPDDATVPVKRSRRYYEAARAAGDPVELVEPPAGGHRIHLDPRSDAWRAAAEFVAA